MTWEAREAFDKMPERNVVSWTAMLRGYVQEGRLKEAREIFDEMPERNVVAWTTMINGYVIHDKVDLARKLFEVMPEKDDVPWSSMIKVYERKGFELEALSLFRLMQLQGIRPNFPSMISTLSVCGSLATLNHGREVHAQLVRSLFDCDVYVCSVLITMYMKCGDLVNGKRVFDRFTSKDTVMWNSIITGYAQHGLGKEALQVFYDMVSSGVPPDEVTFIGVLSACSYTGRVKEGLQLFESMKSKYLVNPKTEHYSCVVDLLGRAGKLNEAMNLIRDMSVEADACVWGALLGACRIHNRLDMAEVVAKKLLLLEPENTGHYILLSNIYSSQGRWRDVAALRSNMRVQSLSKSPGCSWIEVEKKVHTFTGGDITSHPEHAVILRMVEKLDGLIIEVGYSPDGSFVLHDVEEEEKVHNLRHHSEKLAVAYGILKVPKGMPIRIMKNLRVCGDCHAAIKLIAKVTEREIVLRDANRFHHFKDGSCSCGDYW
ncbi:unnamed protein product [Linum tenue]|uniref:DYW domain-containing protein n=1 Tax=Linum tenue TaxID=586396 RepID=A0AAV0H9U3_9ROSI|nr:unnamed protein product [Linum tenue]